MESHVQSQTPASPTQKTSKPAVEIARLERIVLTGFMGAGKSTVGRLLADRLRWEFLDLDASIESRSGLSVPEIFASHGEPHFRRLESQALAAALGRRRLVLALGGGTPEILTNRLLLEQTPATAIAFLDAPFSTLLDRCESQSHEAPGTEHAVRPLLAHPSVAKDRYRLRRPIYKRLASITVETANMSKESAADAILFALGKGPSLSR